MRWDLKPLPARSRSPCRWPDVTPRAGATGPAPRSRPRSASAAWPGTQAVELEYRKPFETSAPGAKTVRFDIVVR